MTVLLSQGENASPVAVITTSLTGCAYGNYRYGLVAADMNKDTHLDVVLTCPNGYVARLFGNGDGTFQSPAYYAVSAPASLAAPVDLNGDGFPDVAVSTFLNNTSGVALLLNQGTGAPGTLSTAVGYSGPTGVRPGSMSAGDFNGDGKQDIVVGGAMLAVYYGNGDGTLQAAQTTPGGANLGPSNLVAADLNHDGLTDVAYIAGQTQTEIISLQVLLGNESGKFATGANLALDPLLGNPTLFLAGTTNNGSNVNLAVIGNYTSILLGDGNGGFQYGNAYNIGGFPAGTEAGADGRTSLVLSTGVGLSTLAGNGDGTFQGTQRVIVGQGDFSTPNDYGQFVTADLNADGLTDVIGIGATGNLVSVLGRGDGTFSSAHAVSGTQISKLGQGDFDEDGNVDVVGISGGTQDATVTLFPGNGDGSFRPGLPAIDLKAPGVNAPVIGDFNGDKHLDIIVSTGSGLMFSPGSGLIFLPGKGDGSFGNPVTFSQQNTPVDQKVLVVDLNNDQKLDLVWNGSVYLGNGDGTFAQSPLGINGPALAIADLNGDGIADLLIGPVPGTSGGIYAGNGNGTFQPTPFYAGSSLKASSVEDDAFASIGDVNADGHPDIVLQSTTSSDVDEIHVLFGDGSGNFTPDNNTYNSSFYIDQSTGGVLARLNNQAPKLPQDNALDYLSFSNGAVIPFLNQTNPKPVLAVSSTMLSASASTAGENQQFALKAIVTGFTPTGVVSFASGGTTLGTATVVDGTATLSTSFATVGAYPVIATYTGDAENQPSTSNTVSIVVAAADFTVTVSPATATISAGQSATAMLTISPVGGYTGTVSFSCGTLPSLTTCTFAPASVTTGNGPAASTTLTLTTTAPSKATQRAATGKIGTLAWASIAFLCLLPRGASKRYQRWVSFVPLTLLACSLIFLSGCGGSKAVVGAGSPSGAPSVPGTPAGTQTITVTGTGSTGGQSHVVVFQVVVQ